jgi:heat shock protein HspQ
MLDRKPNSSKVVIKTYEQWNVLKDNFNLRSLKLYHVVIEDDQYLEIQRGAREQKQ